MEWINVKDKLPEDGQRVLGWVVEVNDLGISGYVWNVCYGKRHAFTDNLKDVVVSHWMPLPAPPTINQLNTIE